MENKSDRRKLTDWIQDYYIAHGWENSEINWKMILSQLKNMETKDSKMKDSGVLYTLWYMSEIRNVCMLDDCENGSILNLVPFYYNQAQAYFLNDRKIKNLFDNFVFENNDVVFSNKRTKHKDKPKMNIDFD